MYKYCHGSVDRLGSTLDLAAFEQLRALSGLYSVAKLLQYDHRYGSSAGVGFQFPLSCFSVELACLVSLQHSILVVVIILLIRINDNDYRYRYLVLYEYIQEIAVRYIACDVHRLLATTLKSWYDHSIHLYT